MFASNTKRIRSHKFVRQWCAGLYGKFELDTVCRTYNISFYEFTEFHPELKVCNKVSEQNILRTKNVVNDGFFCVSV